MIETYTIVLADNTEVFSVDIQTDNYTLVDDYDSGKLSDQDIINLCDLDGEYMIKDIVPVE